MFSLSARQQLFDHPTFKNWFYTILFGILSWILSSVGVAEMNLREIPLLICLIHVRRPAYIFVLCLFVLLNATAAVPPWAVYGVHLIPLMAAWFFFDLLKERKLPNIVSGLAAVVITLGYYFIILLPLVVYATITFINNDAGFSEVYVGMLPLSMFEIVSSALVVSFYLMHFENRKALINHNQNLSQEVEKRTFELTAANNELIALNEELTASNESIKDLNENLERMVKERTDKIKVQLSQLSKYAHMNSHEVRAPLARMLGLMQLIRHNNTPEDQRVKLIDMLYDSSNELDAIIKEMNRLLEKEID